MEVAACVAALLAARPAGARVPDPAALTDAVAALCAAAGVATGDAPAFCAHVGARLDDGELALDRLAARDLAVAWGCAAGLAAAIAVFEAEYLPAARGALARMRAADPVIDEQLQVLRTRVLVGDGRRGPRIAEYRGRGSLRRWIRAVAARQYLNALRDQGREAAVGDADVLDALASPGDGDAELAYLKQRYRGAFADALAAAAAALDPLDRTVLRYTFVDGLGLDALGRALRVSRATAHRRLAAARAALLAGTERELAARLALTPDEVASLHRLVRSQLELSVGRLLADGGGAP